RPVLCISRAPRDAENARNACGGNEMTLSPFDHGPDPELGRMLREALTGPEPEAFLRRVRTAVAAAEPGDQWDVLAGWARPRVKAMAVAAAFLLWLGTWVA